MIWIKIKYRTRLFLNTILFKIDFVNFLLKNRYGERILVFHGIDKVGETKYNSRFHSEAFFDQFIQYIVTHYNVISLYDFYDKKFKPNTLNIAITFDDGYLNNYKYAVPVLQKHAIPATFFITTIHDKANFLWPDFLDLVSFYTSKKEIIFENNRYIKNRNKEFIYNGITLKNKCKKLPFYKIKTLFTLFEDDWKIIQTKSLHDYWQLMDKTDIKQIATNPLFTIGSHSFTHSNLVEIPIEEAKTEILNGKKALETICKLPIFEFAFPFGYYNSELVSYCKEIGFEKILLVDYINKKDEFDVTLRNRFILNTYISMKNQIFYLLKGSYF